MGIWCKLDFRGDVNDSFFRKQCQWRDQPGNMTGDTVDISEYLYCGFSKNVQLKDSAGISPSEPVCGQGSHTGQGGWCDITTYSDRQSYIRIHSNLGTHIELPTNEFKETFVEFDAEIHKRLQAYNRAYE